MNLFDQDIFSYIKSQCKNAFGKSTAGEIRLFVQSIPAIQTLRLLESIEAYVMESSFDIEYHFKIAKGLWQIWHEQGIHKAILDTIDDNNWVDHDDRLTFYRNLTLPQNKEGLLVILIGLDHATDKGGLKDFHIVTEEIIWNRTLNRSFSSWIDRITEESETDTQSKQLLEDLLNNIVKLRSRNLIELAGFIEQELTKSQSNTTIDFVDLFFEKLSFWNIPPLLNVPRSPKKALDYLKKSNNFILHKDFDTSIKRKKAIEKIEIVGKNRDFKDIPETFGDPNLFITIDDFISTVVSFIKNNDIESRNRLLETDLKPLLDTLGTKINRVIKPQKMKKIHGTSLQVFYTAIWMSLVTFKKRCGLKWAPELIGDEILITVKRFKHDIDSDEIEEGQNRNEAAENLLKSCLGGLDNFLKYDCIRLNSSRDSAKPEKEVSIKLEWGTKDREMGYQVVRSTPVVEFEVLIRSEYGNDDVIREFAWVLDETADERIRVQYAKAVMDVLNKRLFIPTFHMPDVMTELFFAADKNEANRLVKTGITGMRVLNILDDLPREELDNRFHDALYELSESYHRYLKELLENGYFYALEHSLHNLIRDYKQTAKLILKGDYKGQFQLMNRFYKAFLIIPENFNLDESFLPCAVVIGITPAVVEIAQARESFLREGFSEVATLILENNEKLAKTAFERLLGLLTIKRPIVCLAKDLSHNLTTKTDSFGLIHCIGDSPSSHLSLASQSLMREDSLESNEVITNIVRPDEESKIVQKVLVDYCKLHPFAHDELQILVINISDLQVTLGGIQEFLNDFLKNDIENYENYSPFHLHLKVITSSTSPVIIANQLTAWRNSWIEKAGRKGQRKLSLTVGQIYAPTPTDIERVLSIENDFINYDIIFLMRFMTNSEGGDEVQPTTEYAYNWEPSNIRKFPISEYPQLVKTNEKLRRRSLLSNRRLLLPTLHSEMSARLKHPHNEFSEYLVSSLVSFEPWKRVLSLLHKKTQWAVCVDPYIDKALLQASGDQQNTNRKIIGFSSGLGLYGELNLTISTETDTFATLTKLIKLKLKHLFQDWSDDNCELAAKKVVEQANEIIGLSLIKATGDSEYIREIVGFSVIKRLFENSSEDKITEFIPIDSFSHWFDDCESQSRPDLLFIEADLKGEYFNVKATVIECKLAKKGQQHVDKALFQATNGLKHLSRVFTPNKKDTQGMLNFDRRYWWAQLQRTLACRTLVNVSEEKYKKISLSLERLSEGYFNIEWKSAIVTIWTDQVHKSVEPQKYDIDSSFSNTFDVPDGFGVYHYEFGNDFISKILINDQYPALFVPGEGIRFDCDIIKEKKGDFSSSSISKKDAGKEKSLIVQKNSQTEKKVQQAKNTYSDVVNNTSVQNENRKLTDEKTQEIKVNAQNQDNASKTGLDLPKRIFLGNSRNDKSVYWEFGHPELNNRHLLLFGASGTGKTYAIQCILAEFRKQLQNSIIIDYTDGFLPNQFEDIFKELTTPKTHFVVQKPLPINPLRPQKGSEDIEGFDPIEENPFQIATRVASVFTSVYSTIGEKQRAILIAAIEEGLLADEHFGLGSLVVRLTEKGDSGEALAAKITPFTRLNLFTQDNKFSWEIILRDKVHKVHILQLYTIKRDIQRLVTEFILWDLYDYSQEHGSKDIPIPIVLDEVQNLDHRSDSPIEKLLREGRKFGVSLILATQTLSNFDLSERDRLFQAAHKLFFKPADTEIKRFADLLRDSVAGSTRDEWVENLSSLNRGECISVGPSMLENGSLKNNVLKIKISSLEKRI